MSAAPQRIPKLTPAEYLAIERAASCRSEYYQGEMFAMAGGSPRHSRITTNVLVELGVRLKAHECTPYNGDLRILVDATGLYTYPDASVICGELELDDEHRDTVLNPAVLVEVLSESTEAYDRGKKFNHYRRIESLKEYVLVSQDEPRIEHYLRCDDGSWKLTEATGLEATLPLPTLGIDLPLREVYDKLDFSEPSRHAEA